MYDALVICTRNRPQDLERCLSSVLRLTTPPSLVFVVDQSTNNESQSLVERMFGEVSQPQLICIPSKKRGLVLARNEALDAIPPTVEIIHFVDDDTELLEDYFLNINSEFKSNPDAAGVGGNVLGSGQKHTDRVLSFFGLDSCALGSVLATGVNIGVYEHPDRMEVDWLPGCSMSFSRRHIEGLVFDVGRGVWAMGEDVDFGLRASTRGKLVYLPSAKLIHHLSPTNRDSLNESVFQDVISRWSLAKDHPGKVSKAHVLISCVIQAGLLMIFSVPKADKSLRGQSRAVMRGLYVALLRGGFRDSRFSN